MLLRSLKCDPKARLRKSGFHVTLCVPWMSILFLGLTMETRAMAAEDASSSRERLTSQQAVALIDLAMAGIEREFPNKPSQVMVTQEDVKSPHELHPVFYGCFDWHSSVHGHWVLIRLLKLYPDNERADAIRALLNRQFTAEKLQAEADYFLTKENKSFERMYGWAWLLRLATELHGWDDGDARRWRSNLRPLETRIVELTKEYLPKLSFPIRTGEHTDTGFALAQELDYARAVGDDELEAAIVRYGLAKFSSDRDYPARYEPSGHDFFSTCLNEADLMRRVMSPAEFSEWLQQFLPELAEPNGSAQSLLTPAKVSDVTDGKLVHLAGLNFNRGWTQAGIASVLPASDARRQILLDSVARHEQAGLEYVFSGHYEGEHWLGTFAVYLLTESGISVTPD